MEIKLKSVYIISFFLFASCESNKDESNELEIRLLNKSVLSYNIDNYKNNHYLLNIHKDKRKNVIKFYIKNNSDNKYILKLPILHESIDYNIGLENTIIRDKNGDTLKYKFRFLDQFLDRKIEDWIIFNDSLTIVMYKNLGYKNDLNHKKIENDMSKTIILHPNEKIFIESLIGLPINSLKDLKPDQYVDIQSYKEYKFQLQFKIDSFKYKNHLTSSEIETIKENNYKIFHGTLVSNAVPIKFID